MIVYRVGDGFQDAHGRAVTEDGTLLDPQMPPPANKAELDAMAEAEAEKRAAKEQKDEEPARQRAAKSPAKKK